jgi:peptidoglycan/LPS O-acetylase OafA/YrhL
MDRAYRAKETRKLVIFGIIIFGILETGFICLVFPSCYTDYLLYIPVYFLLLGIGILLILSRMKRKRLHPGRAVARLMLFNVAQMLLSFLLLFCYYYFINVQEDTVLIAFSVFYVFFMGLKLFILYNIDKLHKIETKRLQHDAEKNK